MPEPQSERKNWWATLPGVLTGLAALIGAVGGLYAAIVGQPIPQPTPTPTVMHSSPAVSDPCKALPVDDRPISCLGEKNDH
jgi:hypothetical protein